MQVQIYTLFNGHAVLGQAVAAATAPEAEVALKLAALLRKWVRVPHGLDIAQVLHRAEGAGYTHHWAEATL